MTARTGSGSGWAWPAQKDAPVLILDEATNALDHETELAVVKTLDELRTRGRTIIIISHRESAVRDCDMLIRIEHGRIAI